MRYLIQTFCAAAAMVLTLGSACAQAPAAKPKPLPAPAVTNSEINLLRIEVQHLRNDLELLKGHIGSVVQYLQQRDQLAYGG